MARKLKKEIEVRIDGLVRNRALTVIILPSGVFGFREGRSRKTYWLPIMTGYRFAIEADLASKKRKAKKS